MRQSKQSSGERIVKDIKRKTRKQYSAEEKTRIVLDGLIAPFSRYWFQLNFFLRGFTNQTTAFRSN